ncbi:hypothetical protein LCGC14_1227270 [marine sediment metagenome]|uniref:Uncharacterized protein n=1 Tax=marine sediment metagenome TaxID=412755 RepID=A0A0F9PDX8_9ZZZZ
MIYANTCTGNPTYFPAALALIQKARKRYGVASENWPYPTRFNFGNSRDNYYAEVWTDGMDWQSSYWLIEQVNFEQPQIYPLIIFDSHENEVEFNSCDFEQLLRAVMFARRNALWLKSLPEFRNFFHNDTVWPFVFKGDPHPKIELMHRCYMKHNSQPFVEFWMNTTYLEDYLKNWPRWTKEKIDKAKTKGKELYNMFCTPAS